jgi:hypothetical protein
MPTPVYPLLTSVLPSYYNEEAPEWPGAVVIFQDGAADRISLADTPIRRWTINYSSDGGITAAEAGQFTTLIASVRYNPQEGSLIAMNFTPRGESLLSNVYFDSGGFSIRRGRKAHIYMVECKLIHRP